MREHLFRGKVIRCEGRDAYPGYTPPVWAIGSFHKNPSGNCVITDYEDNDTYSVDPETVGQYTGLLDKNGVKIFEGDILSVNTARGSEPHYEKRVVEWKTPYFSGFVYDKAEYKAQYHEVVGNIHDNPELLEAKP